MSFQAMAWAVKQPTKSTGTKLVLLMLANYADENGNCYPSQAHLAKICHCSRQSINKYISDLVELGFVNITKKSNGLLVHNSYNLKMTIVKNIDNAVSNVKISSNQCQNIGQNTIINTYTDNFDEFWNIVPRKISKTQARKAYLKALKDKKIDHISLMRKMKEYGKSVQGKEQQFVLHPSTWINQCRWEDELDSKIERGKNWLAG
tara:strand:+ start:1058 stop:1672 length:615 start_codon:yes stop_codon:yes gene_type:complete